MAILPIITLLLLFGILTGANLFALGASTFLVVIQLARYFSSRWIEAVSVVRNIESTEIQIGSVIAVGLQMKNDTAYSIPWLLIEDQVAARDIKQPPFALRLLTPPARLQWFPARKPSLFIYSVQALRRGYYQLGPTLLETGDLLGLHRSFRIANQPEYITVLPKLFVMEGVQIGSRRPMGEMKSEDRVLEDPTLMAGLRRYEAGDPMNRVHWKATARTGVLHTRVFEPTCIQGAMMIVDMHESTNPSKNEPVRTDLAVTAAASIGHWLFMQGEPFGLISNGRDAAERVRELNKRLQYSDRREATEGIEMRARSDRLRPIVMGANRTPEHFAELHRTLARLERTDGLKLHELIGETSSRIPKLLSLIVIGQKFETEGVMSLAMLRRRGFQITVVLNCPSEDYLDAAGPMIAERIAVISLENEESLKRVLEHC